MKAPEILTEKCASCGHERREHLGLCGWCANVAIDHRPHTCACERFVRAK
jgi:hypothetical protein